MSKSELENLPEDKKALIRNILTFSGIGFFMLGMALVAFPSYSVTFFGEGQETLGRILGIALVIVGITDAFIGKVLFRSNKNKDEEIFK